MSCEIYDAIYGTDLKVKPEFSITWGSCVGTLAKIEKYSSGWIRYGLYLQDNNGVIVLRFFQAKELEQAEGSLPFNPDKVCYTSFIKQLR